MRKGSRHLSPEEARLWRRVVAKDRPLDGKSLPPLVAEEAEAAASEKKPPAKKSSLKSAALLKASVAQEGNKPVEGKVSSALKPKIPKAHDFGEDRKVRRGKVAIEGRLDLHGLNQRAAEQTLRDFVLGGTRQRKRCVLVITGKGSEEKAWPEPQRGVLKRRLPEWLDALAREGLISGFAVAHRSHGGDGAFYVFLRVAAP